MTAVQMARGAAFELRLPGEETLTLGGESPCRVMGILNVTKDSFSDGGRFLEAPVAVEHALRMAEEGADIIDVGGESTRPGSEAVPPEEQARRILPVIEGIARRSDIPISVDTSSADVARRALDAGARIVNDVTALRGDPGLAPLLVERGVPVVLMHMRGTPRDMQKNPVYDDVVADIARFLGERVAFAVSRGIERDQIVVDPGIGFGKTLAHNLELLRRLDEFHVLGRPVLIGTSRKSMIGAILDRPTDERLFGTLATVAASVERRAAMVRVHDVRPAVDVIRVMAAILGRAEA